MAAGFGRIEEDVRFGVTHINAGLFLVTVRYPEEIPLFRDTLGRWVDRGVIREFREIGAIGAYGVVIDTTSDEPTEVAARLLWMCNTEVPPF